jgi:N4-gp56 family major capsid protein
MATTSATANLTAKIWAGQTQLEAVKANFFDKFSSEASDNVIQIKKDLSKNKGDTMVLPLTMLMSGAGIAGDSTLEGSEEALTLYDFSVTVNQLRNGVLLAGLVTEQKLSFDLRSTAKTALAQWFTDYLENRFITVMTAAYTATEFTVATGGGPVVTEATISDVNALLTCADISAAKRKALLHAPKIAPIKVDGKDYYVMLIHPYAARDLKKDTTWINAQLYAGERSSDNPLFTGALGFYDGVALFEYERVSVTATGATAANVAHNLLLGKQAGFWAVAKPMFWKEKVFDYENQTGFAVGYIGAIAKTVFNAKDYGVIQVMSSAKAS